MYSRILIPIDGNEDDERAIREGATLAAATGATVRFLHVVDTGDVTEEPERELFESALEREGRTALDRATELAREAGAEAVEQHTVRGKPSVEIVNDATKVDADVVVMATHNRRGLDRFLLGSVTQRVLHHSPVPVLVVRTDEPVDGGDTER